MSSPSPETPEIRTELFIGGRRTPARSGRTFDTVDPSTEEIIARVARGGPEDVADAVRAAREAFEAGGWPRMAPDERARILYRTARELEGRVEEFARLETLDTGKPLAFARDEIRGCVKYFDYYAGAADKIHGETVPLGPEYLNYTVREPMGVTAHIVPWNAPLSMVCRSLAPALAAGNTAVVKPAEQTPLTALAFSEILCSAGLPDGAYNVVAGFGPEAGAALCEHSGIDSMTFTGSADTGKAVLRAAADHIRPVVAELGGKSPQIVFADSDLDLVAGEIAKGIYSNSGQYCDAGARLLVDRSVREPLLQRLVERAHDIEIGPGMDSPDMGPLVSAEHYEKVTDHLDSGVAEGAEMITGGRAEGFERGYFVAPTIFDRVQPDSRLAREEIFGPVLAVMPFDDEARAAELANATDYGLAAGIFTRDIDRALRFANDVRAGYVQVNEYFIGGMGSPFGGYKQSGIGRERGLAALENYTQIKNVVVRVR